MTTPDPLKLARDALAPLPKPYAWMTNESARRLKAGGNCKGPVPVHGKSSATAKNELFIGAQMQAMYEAGFAAAIDALPASVQTGGSAEHMLQDQSRELSRWLSNQPGARLHATEAAAAIAQAAPAPAPLPDAQALQQARWEGIQSAQVQTAEIVRAALELLDSVGEGLPPDALAAFKRVFGGAAPAVAAPEPLRWQPIETAPKDGTMFLCWVSAVRYGETDEGQQYQQDASQIDFCWWRPPFDGVPDSDYFDNASGQVGDSQAVTHWMPLPAAPAAQEPQHG